MNMIAGTVKKPIQILLVDDHQSFIDGLQMLINSNKYVMQVIGTANNREEALKAAIEKKPDLILLDVDLGSDNGIEVLPELLEKTEAKVIMLTGAQDQKIHEEAILSGAHGILLKNSAGEIILKAIQKVYRGEIWANNDLLGKVLTRLQNPKSNKKSDDPEQQKIESLTTREKEIISMIANDGSSTNKEIAGCLFISESTLKNHLSAIYSKLGLRNRIDLLKYALTHKLDKSND